MCSVDAYKLFRDLRWRVHLCCVPKYLQMSIMCLSPFCCLLVILYSLVSFLFQFSAWYNNAIKPSVYITSLWHCIRRSMFGRCIRRSLFEQWAAICNMHLFVWSTLRGFGEGSYCEVFVLARALKLSRYI